MKTTIADTQNLTVLRPRQYPTLGSTWAALVLTMSLVASRCPGQGTMTFQFEGQPPGTRNTGLGFFDEAGMRFSVIPPGGLFLSGGSISGYADNGTGHLEIPDAFVGGGGLSFRFINNPTPFNLLSFDAAEYFAGGGPSTLTVIGYRGDLMGLRVTNSFTLDGINDGPGGVQDFQTFTLDSTFINLGRVDILNSRFSLDNLVISGVPEPSTCALLCFGAAFAALHHRRRVARDR